MKNIFKTFIIAGAGLISFASCSDFLDQSSPSEMFPENVYASERMTEQALNKVYSGLTLDKTYGCRVPLNFSTNSDIELVDAIKKDDVEATGRDRGNSSYNTSSEWSEFNENWTRMYEMIENANLVIEGIRSSDIRENKAMKIYLGEALCLRSMIFFDLIRNYGDVPMKMQSTNTDGSNFYVGKTDRDVIMDALLVDLDEAAGLLPWAGEEGYNTERCTKGFAYGLAARIALFEGGYSIRESRKAGYVDLNEKREGQMGYSDGVYPTMRPSDEKRKELYEHALTCLDAIIGQGVHKLNPSYEDEWARINQLTLDGVYYENLFEVAHGLNYSGEMGYTAGVRMNGVSSQFGFGNSSGKVKLTAPFFMSFDPEDTRRDITCAPFELRGTTATQTMQNSPWGIYVGKWDVRKMSSSWLAVNQKATTKTGYGINWIVMRYSDVLLMYAEVVNELYGPNGAGTCGKTAVDALIEVRNRAFPEANRTEKSSNYAHARATDKDTFFKAIVDERAWELAAEAVRKYDLIRWGLLIDKTVEMLDSYRNAINNGLYPSKLYYNEDSSASEWYKIDYSSICWYEEPENTANMKSVSFWGNVVSNGVVDTDNANYDALQWISSGLISYNKITGLQGTSPNGVVNRHIFPIGRSTVNNSNGTLQNSYGY